MLELSGGKQAKSVPFATLITPLKRLVEPPSFDGDDGKTRQAALINAAILAALLYLGFMFPMLLLGGTTRAVHGVILALLFLAAEIILIRSLK